MTAGTITPTTSRQVTLPASPKTGSPMPWLTSIHAVQNRGPWGDAGYRGNCSRYLIEEASKPRRGSSTAFSGATAATNESIE